MKDTNKKPLSQQSKKTDDISVIVDDKALLSVRINALQQMLQGKQTDKGLTQRQAQTLSIIEGLNDAQSKDKEFANSFALQLANEFVRKTSGSLTDAKKSTMGSDMKSLVNKLKDYHKQFDSAFEDFSNVTGITRQQFRDAVATFKDKQGNNCYIRPNSTIKGEYLDVKSIRHLIDPLLMYSGVKVKNNDASLHFDYLNGFECDELISHEAYKSYHNSAKGASNGSAITTQFISIMKVFQLATFSKGYKKIFSLTEKGKAVIDYFDRCMKGTLKKTDN